MLMAAIDRAYFMAQLHARNESGNIFACSRSLKSLKIGHVAVPFRAEQDAGSGHIWCIVAIGSRD